VGIILRLHDTTRNRAHKITGTTNSPMEFKRVDRGYNWPVAKKVGAFYPYILPNRPIISPISDSVYAILNEDLDSYVVCIV